MMTLGPNNDNIQAQTTSSWDAFMANATSSSSPPTASSSLAPAIQEHQSSSRIPDDISLFSVNDILSLYKHDTDLLKHVLAAKAQEDRRKTAEEFRQVEEARLRFKFTDFEMDDFQTPPFSSVSNQAQSPQNFSTSTFSESSIQATQYYDHQNSPATELDLLLSSPPPMVDQDFQSMYMMNSQQHQSSPSITTSMSNLAFPVMDPAQDINLDIPVTSFSLPTSFSPSFVASGPLFSQSPNMGYHMADVISTTSSVSSLESTPLVADLSVSRPLNESPLLDQIMQPAKHSNSAPTSGSNRGIEKKKTASKHKRRQLSTTSLPGFSSSTHVLRWAAKKKRTTVQTPLVNVNKEPQVPLDHGTVMEALRAKLLRIQSSPSSEQESLDTPFASSSLSSSPPAASSTPFVGSRTPPPPPPPRSPPVDTQPSTGILFLDLKHKTARRKKSYSVTNDCRNH
ncbi:hypothetical protein [Absidia glauca]|uniref:Uncharacterized protein n=1 Tax=Absidia glauca TaxID=4829 RepID=A0A163K7J8_ABSGL|nr:hypothetical protein [Absidia glauca]